MYGHQLICRSLLSLTEVPVKLASVEQPFKGYLFNKINQWNSRRTIWELQGKYSIQKSTGMAAVLTVLTNLT